MKLIAVVLVLQAARAPEVTDQAALAKALEIDKACTAPLVPLRSLGQPEPQLLRGFAAAFDNFGELSLDGDFGSKLHSYILAPLNALFLTEKIETPEELRERFVAGVGQVFAASQSRVDKGALEAATTSLFMAHFFAQVCRAEHFDFDFLNAADSVAKAAGVKSDDAARFSTEYNDFKRFAKEQLSELVLEQTDFLCRCRGVNGLNQLSRILHRSLFFMGNNDVLAAEQIPLAVQRYLTALRLVHDNVPKGSLTVSFFKEHLDAIGRRVLRTLELEAAGNDVSPAYSALLVQLLKAVALSMRQLGEKQAADASVAELLRKIGAEHFARGASIESFAPYVHSALAAHPDLALPDKSDEKQFRLAQLRVFELFTAKLEPTERQMDAVVNQLDRLLDLDVELVGIWNAGFTLHSAQFYQFGERLDSDLLAQCHDLINEFVVSRRPSFEEDKFAAALDQHLDQLQLQPDKERLAFFLKLVNGLGLFGVLPPSDYQLNYAVGPRLAGFVGKLEQSWELGGIIGMAEEAAQATGRLPASFFAQFMKVEEQEAEHEDAGGKMQFNDVGDAGFKKARVGGDLDEVRIEQDLPREFTVSVIDINADCLKAPSEKQVTARPSENVERVEYLVRGERVDKQKFDEAWEDCLHPLMVTLTTNTLLPDCTIRPSATTRKALHKLEPLEQTFYVTQAAPQEQLTKERFDELLHLCNHPTLYTYTVKELVDCKPSSSSRDSPEKPASVDLLTQCFVQVGSSRRPVSESEFETESRNCYKLLNTKVTRHSVNVLFGKLAEERVRAIRESPDMLAFFAAQPAEEVVNGVQVEFAYVLINRDSSPCKKANLY